MTAELMTAIAVTPALLAAIGGSGALWLAARRDRAADPTWQPDPIEQTADLGLVHILASVPAADLRPACPVCSGRHCAGCEEPARHTATWRHHIGRHAQDEIPPSILRPALLMDVVARARELTRQVGRGRPPLALRTRVALAPTAWAKRLGRPVQLAGCSPRTAVLP